MELINMNHVLPMDEFSTEDDGEPQIRVNPIHLAPHFSSP